MEKRSGIKLNFGGKNGNSAKFNEDEKGDIVVDDNTKALFGSRNKMSD